MEDDSEDEDAMIDFIKQSLRLDNPFIMEWSLPDDLNKAVGWILQRTPWEARSFISFVSCPGVSLCM